MNNLYFTIGCARSGKSTACNEWLRKTRCEKPRVVVCSDEIRLALHKSRYNSAAEPMVFAIKQVMIKTLLTRHDVAVDGTHTTEISIRRILEINPNAQPWIYDTPMDVCIERAHATNQSDLIPVIERHHRQMQKLLDEGIDNVINRLLNDIKLRHGDVDKVI